ncbi:MAG: hypothetical protein U5K74_04530 [Gemmatimonadaceae bacterium]|nr:hypothetical protein [Gemmatimonadaceae bacterium]
MTPTLSDETIAITLCAEGSVLADSGDAAGALARYRQAAETAPSLLALHLILANAQQLQGDVLAARATLRHAMRTADRSDVTTEFTLGKALVEAGAGADAVPCFRRVRAEFPGDAAAAAALAAALRDAQQPEEAWIEVRHALRLAPDDPVALFTAALIRHDLGDYAGALGWCERSLSVRPDSAGVIVTRGYLRHLLGDAAGGWTDLESRPLPQPETDARPWHGEPLEGRTLLVIGEQGVGDQFQFLRFVWHPSIQAADRVVIACQPDAVALLRASGYEAVARDAVVETDYFVPLLSLPVRLGVGAEWRGSSAAYLSVPDSLPHPAARVRRVGVTWAGNPSHRNDSARSIAPSMLHGLLHTHPAIRFVCLQHGVHDDDLPPGTWDRPVSGDWLETARQLCTLDLLITVDTGIAHLAGALGVPVWILLPRVPDWRWGVEGNATPWYPTARLFRQPARGDWARVLTNVSAALSGAEL